LNILLLVSSSSVCISLLYEALNDTEMLHGSCLCGKVKYEADLSGDAATTTSLCHCRMCRKITGSTTSVNLAISPSKFHLVSGELKKTTRSHADEGFDFSILFCPDCGSPIYAEAHNTPGLYFIQAGTLDDTEALEAVPKRELNMKHRMEWISPVKGAAQKRTYVD